ncbi:uncharacterized protein B0I36DRAFT_64361 [Microdochium trichocladiopsis]|uniref:Uncharacterized protein n=1 Tax=Microdochium trichocladiopsis TaxID=1682393 RepID=A0A9P9BRX6_9PEZI|nr:uncharacterized protein B0I36DRAFT_64361 [Microdochium trichocladiopsis]KAH7037315.1 hypothetical protein B0I36DRAFT_64361 [Microdochium trichocladiopsis]
MTSLLRARTFFHLLYRSHATPLGGPLAVHHAAPAGASSAAQAASKLPKFRRSFGSTTRTQFLRDERMVARGSPRRPLPRPRSLGSSSINNLLITRPTGTIGARSTTSVRLASTILTDDMRDNTNNHQRQLGSHLGLRRHATRGSEMHTRSQVQGPVSM